MCITTITFLSIFFVIPFFFCFSSIINSILDKDGFGVIFGIILLLFFSVSSILCSIAVYNYEIANLL